MKKYKIVWEVSKYSIVEARNEAEAIQLFNDNNEGIEQIESEVTASPMAYEI